ncbi:MAG: hypothetical protein ACOY32_11175 [Thermodesulfobacteriota bacterium]
MITSRQRKFIVFFYAMMLFFLVGMGEKGTSKKKKLQTAISGRMANLPWLQGFLVKKSIGAFDRKNIDGLFLLGIHGDSCCGRRGPTASPECQIVCADRYG